MDSNSRRYRIDLVNNETGDKKTIKIFKMTFAEAASHAYGLENGDHPGKYRVSCIKEVGKVTRWLNL